MPGNVPGTEGTATNNTDQVCAFLSLQRNDSGSLEQGGGGRGVKMVRVLYLLKVKPTGFSKDWVE